MAIQEDLAFGADVTVIQVVDISDPARPVLAGAAYGMHRTTSLAPREEGIVAGSRAGDFVVLSQNRQDVRRKVVRLP